jgi:hypothetical protein
MLEANQNIGVTLAQGKTIPRKQKILLKYLQKFKDVPHLQIKSKAKL